MSTPVSNKLVTVAGLKEAYDTVLADVYSKSQTYSKSEAVAKADIVNNLTSTATNKPLSAAQGKALNEAVEGKVSKTGDTMSGNLGIKPPSGGGNLALYHGDRSNNVGSIYGAISSNGNGRIGIGERASDSDSLEYFVFPNPTSPGSVSEVLTTKNLVSVAQGGTGASNAADARTNLDITPANIGASLYLSETTWSGIYTKLSRIATAYSSNVYIGADAMRFLTGNKYGSSSNACVGSVARSTNNYYFHVSNSTGNNIYAWRIDGLASASSTPTIGTVYRYQGTAVS